MCTLFLAFFFFLILLDSLQIPSFTYISHVFCVKTDNSQFFLTTNTRLCSTWQNLYKVNAKKDEYVIPVLHTILICPFCSLAQGWCYFKKKNVQIKKKENFNI